MVKNRLKINAILIATVLLFVVATPYIASAQKPAVAAINLGDQEKSIIKNINNTEYNEYNVTKAKELLEQQKIKNSKEIEASIDENYKRMKAQGSIPVITSPTCISGQSTVSGVSAASSVSTANDHDWGDSTWGVAPFFIEHDVSYSEKKILNKALTGPGGYGNCGAWGWVGYTFLYGGTGKYTNIAMDGYMYGLTSAVAGGQSDTEIKLVIYDHYTGTRSWTTIYHENADVLGWKYADDPFNNGFGYNLQQGHEYTIYLEISGSAAVTGAGEAGSNFFDGGASAKYYSLSF